MAETPGKYDSPDSATKAQPKAEPTKAPAQGQADGAKRSAGGEFAPVGQSAAGKERASGSV